MTEAPHSYPVTHELKCWKEGRLEPCSLAEFVISLRRYAGLVDRETKHRSDPMAHVGERLMAAADAMERTGGVAQQPSDLAREAEKPSLAMKNLHEASSIPSTQVPAQAAWQPIETAPKDKELLLGWYRTWPEPSWEVAAGLAGSTRGGWMHGQATHWMPQPGPPLPSTDPRCTCAAIVNPNIPHARSCPLSRPDREIEA